MEKEICQTRFTNNFGEIAWSMPEKLKINIYQGGLIWAYQAVSWYPIEVTSVTTMKIFQWGILVYKTIVTDTTFRTQWLPSIPILRYYHLPELNTTTDTQIYGSWHCSDLRHITQTSSLTRKWSSKVLE